MKFVYWTVLLIIVLSCNKKSVDTYQEPIEITVFDLSDEVKSQLNGIVTVTRNGELIQYGYTEDSKDSVFTYSITRNIKNDSILIYDDGNEICLLTGIQTYDIQNERIIVKRYLYDVAGMFDEEASFFFIDNYGLVAIDVLAGNQLFFDNGSESGKAIIEYLKKDTAFYRPKLPPPPLPIDYDPNEIEAELDTITR